MSKSSSEFSSGMESCIEQYEWANDVNFPYKSEYLRFPLDTWRKLAYNPKLDNWQFGEEGKYYQNIVNIILEKDVFYPYKVYQEKNGAIDINFKNIYKINYDLFKKRTIVPDFFVRGIPIAVFKEILNSRNYMFYTRYNIPSDKIKITVLGETKSSYNHAHKNSTQRKDYITFANEVNKSGIDEFVVIVYIYDQSFQLFKAEPNKNTDGPFIYGYIPKVYKKECYNVYNYLVQDLNANQTPIDLTCTKFQEQSSETHFSSHNKKLETSFDNYKKKYFIALSVIIILIAIIILNIFNKKF